MATISKIEDLLVWQKSRLLVREVFTITSKEFIHFLYNANGSLNELKSQLYISTDFKLISDPGIEISLKLILEIELMIKALSKKLKLSDFTGAKFKKQNFETLNLKLKTY